MLKVTILSAGQVLIEEVGATSVPVPTPSPVPVPAPGPTPTSVPTPTPSPTPVASGTIPVTWGQGAGTALHPEAQQSIPVGTIVSYQIDASQLFGTSNRVKVELYEANGAFTFEVSDKPQTLSPTARQLTLQDRFPAQNYVLPTMSDTEFNALAVYGFKKLPPSTVYYINIKANDVVGSTNPAEFWLFYTNA